MYFNKSDALVYHAKLNRSNNFNHIFKYCLLNIEKMFLNKKHTKQDLISFIKTNASRLISIE